MALYAHKFNADAIKCFQQAEQLDPQAPNWWYLHGMILAETDTAQGLPFVEKAALLAGNNVTIRLRLAEFLFDLRRLDDSRRQFEAARQIDQENARALLGLARIALQEKKWQESLEMAELARQNAPARRDIYELLAQLYRRLDRQSEAAASLEQLKRLQGSNIAWPDPIVAEVVLLRADTGWLNDQANQLLEQGQIEQHIRILARLVQLEPEVPTWHIRLARALLRAGSLPAAEDVIRQGLNRHPDAVELGLLGAIVANQQEKYSETVERLQKVLALKPDYPEAHYILSFAQRKLGRTTDAIESLKNVLRYEPLYAAAHKDLGELLLSAGNREEAVKHLRIAVEQDPRNVEAKRLLRDAGG
jgi:tetratricopeptide (TPR) repeat protein